MIFKQLAILAFVSLIKLTAIHTQVVSISGQVLRHNGDPSPDVMVTCSNGDSIITDENGSFEFSDLISGQDYQIDGSFEASIFEEISVLDACYNRFVVNQIYSVLNSQLLANDYNQDGAYQGLDFIRIAYSAIKVENNLNELDAPWRFFDGHIDSINTNEVEPRINLENLSSDTSGLVLIAVKSGDVAIDTDHQPSPPNAPHPMFYIPDTAIEQGEEILVSVKVRDLEKIMGFQHALAWDTTYLEFISYENRTNVFELWPNEAYVEEGLFPIMEIDPSGIFAAQSMADDFTVYEVRFNALQDANSLIGILGFDSLLMHKQVVYLDSSILYLIEAEYNIEEKEPTSTTLNLPHMGSFEISPIPAVEELRFSVQLLKLETSIISLLDANGKLLQRQTFNTQNFTGEMHIENLPNGTYYLQLQTKEGLSSRPFIKL